MCDADIFASCFQTTSTGMEYHLLTLNMHNVPYHQPYQCNSKRVHTQTLTHVSFSSKEKRNVLSNVFYDMNEEQSLHSRHRNLNRNAQTLHKY